MPSNDRAAETEAALPRETAAGTDQHPGGHADPTGYLDHAEPSAPAGSSGVLIAAGFGFLIGAVFWHFIGFWGFVREVVLKGPDREMRQIAQTGRSCTAVSLDRATGILRMDSCPGDAPWLGETAGSGKADLALTRQPAEPKRWSVTVQAEAETSEDR